MKTKAKKFSYKLLALFMALVMGITCFSGVMTSYAASKDIKYVDSDVEYNDIAWNVLSDEQLATAILDYADEMLPILAGLEKQLAAMVDGMKVSVLTINWDINKRQISLKALGTVWVTITVKLGSVDELMETLESVADALSGGIVNLVTSFGLDLGIIDDLNFDSIKGLRRTSNTSCEIVRGVLGLIYNNLDIIDQVFRGTLSLGVLNDTVNVYKIVGDLFDAPSGYQSDFVYNLVQSIIFKYTKWFTDEEKAAFRSNPSSFVYDEILLDKMTSEFLTKINAEITYNTGSADGTADGQTVSSRARLAKIQALVKGGMTFRAAAESLGYDPDIVYTNDGNVYLFVYGTNEDGSIADDAQKISLGINDSLFAFGYQALDLAWKTALKDTVNTVRVNYNVDRGHGSNFDNTYYYWAKANLAGGWDTNNLPAMYSMDNINAWANAPVDVPVELTTLEDGTEAYVNKDSKIVFDNAIVSEKFDDEYNSLGFFASTTTAGSYGAENAEEFLGWVKNNYTFDRTIAEDAKGTWADIDEETLFNKLRYSPLADYAFDIQTGPINLYFMQTGVKNLEGFFNNYSGYKSLVAGLNDCLVAAVKDIFVDRDNIFVETKGDTDVPTMAVTDVTSVNQATTIGSEQLKSITNTLVGNALKIVQYTADTTDRNILNGFYTNPKYGANAALTEANLEEAMIPMLVACIGQVNLSGDKLEDLIHPEDWNRAKDAEAVAFIALREYLSYVLPQKNYNALAEFTDEKITVTFDDIKIMARDALIYVVEPYVPVTDKNNNRWTADTEEIDMTTDIFDLLNSVVCYYADFYTSWDVSNRNGEKGLGAAPLLGLYDDATDKSLINKDNTIWENIDVAINKILPVVGTLQGNGYGNAKSEDLIMRDVINGILDIGNPVSGTNMYGVSNFIYRLLTFVSAEPIQTTPVVTTVYNLLKDFINSVFGPRYNGQTWVPVPAATSSHPFDDFFHVGVLAGTGSDNVGAIHKLFGNFIEFSGFGPRGIHSYDDTILPGLTFAVSAVNSFFNFLPFIGEHQLKLATAEYDPSAVTGAAPGSEYNANIVVTNNATGINTAYIDGMNNNEVVQNPRYYIQVTGVKMVRSDGSASEVTNIPTTKVAPGENVKIPVKTSFTNQSNNSCSYIATITYNIYSGSSGSPIHSGIETNAYQFMSSATSWYDIVYPSTREESGIRRFPESLEPGAGGTAGTEPNRTKSTANFGAGNSLYATYPETIVVSTTTLSLVNSMGFRLRNDNGTNARSIDGIYFYDNNKTVQTNDTTRVVTEFTSSTTGVTVGKANAIPVFDKETGDLLHYDYYDISTDGVNWDRTGYDDTALQEKMQQAQAEGKTLHTRTHVAYTLKEAIDNKIIAAYYVNSSNEYEYMYLQTGNLSYNTLLSNVSMRGPVDGIRVNTGHLEISKNSSRYIAPLTYDGGADVAPGLYESYVNFYTTDNNNGTAKIDLYIADDGSASALSEKYATLSALLANYRQSDFVDYDAATGKSQVFADAQDAVLQALTVEGSVLNATTALGFADKTVLAETTKTTTSENGDQAFVPFSTRLGNDSALPASIKNAAYVGGSLVNGEVLGGVTGIYYFDANCTMPIYSNVPLTSANVRNGQDPAGVDVNAVTADGKTTYYLANDKHMETEWNTTEFAPYAWLAKTDVQAKDDAGKPLYDQIQYVYRDSNGNKVNSDENWVCKFPATENQIIENVIGEADNRGLYTRAIDNITYRTDVLLEKLDTTLAESFITDVSEAREGLIESNFDIITYNKMVDVAKEIEGLYKVVVTYDSQDKVTDEEGNVSIVTKEHTATVSYDSYKGYRDNKDITIKNVAVSSTLSSLQIEQYLADFDFAMSNIIERGYIGDRLQDEIVCAAQGQYGDFTVTTATRDADGKVTADATVSSTAVANPQFGAYVGGQLVNAGAVIYPSNLWSNYVNALADAVALAQFGNGDYAFASRDYYDTYSKDDYTAQVAKVYRIDSNLQVAEIALENVKVITLEAAEGGTVTFDGVTYDKTVQVAVPENEHASITINPNAGNAVKGVTVNGKLVPVTKNEDGQYVYEFKADDTLTIAPVFTSAGITISGKVTIAASADGADSGFGLRNVRIIANPVLDSYGRVIGGDEVGISNAEGDRTTYGNFEISVPTGTTQIAITGDSTVDRVVTISGTDSLEGVVIPVAICDYNRDTLVNGTDLAGFLDLYGGDFNANADYNADNLVNGTDLAGFLDMYNSGVSYAPLALD